VTSRTVYIIHTGVANIASMMAAFRRLGWEPFRTEDPELIRRAERVVLPGVGAFGEGMARLRELGMLDIIIERAAADRPLLAVCLGLQLLCECSEESPGVQGLGIIPSKITRFAQNTLSDTVRIPQFGWNFVRADDSCVLLESGYAYFANSYRLKPDRDDELLDWNVAWTEHGGPFVSALERGRLLACQFHPEISSKWGSKLLERWLEA
jgi:imidazole glycerol phosphate synthase glutamine amidotransferase subunit